MERLVEHSMLAASALFILSDCAVCSGTIFVMLVERERCEERRREEEDAISLYGFQSELPLGKVY